jgi:hypothetical protein
VPGERHVVLVHVDGDVERGACLLGEADVVEVGVREDDRGDVVARAAEARERVAIVG